MKKGGEETVKILVVDDDPVSAGLLKTKLSMLGYEITVAHSAVVGSSLRPLVKSSATAFQTVAAG